MALRLLTFLAALAHLPVPALADDLEGAWAFRIGEANIFVFEVEQSDTEEWTGTWTRPESFASNGVVFAQMEGSERVESMAALEFAGFIELSFDDPRPGAIPDIFRIRVTGEDQAELVYVGTEFEPYPLVRVAPGTPIGPFEAAMIYDRDNAVTRFDYIELGAAGTAEVAAEPETAQGEGAMETEDESEEEAPRITADFLDDL